MRIRALTTLGACVIGLTTSFVPIFVAGTAVLLVPIAKQTGWSRGEVSTCIAAGLIGLAVGSAMVGRLITRFGPRRVILLSTVAFPLSLAAFSFAPTVGVAIALAVMVGFLGAGVSQFSYLTVPPLFFERRLGLSLGTAMIGMGLGNAIVPVLGQLLSQTFDWRTIYQILAGAVFLISLPTMLLCLQEPTRKSVLQCSGSDRPKTKAPEMSVREAIRSGTFWKLALCVFLSTAVISGLGIHLTAMMTDRGYGPGEAAAIFSLWGAAVAVSRFGGGVILDYIDARWIGAGFLVGATIGAILLASGATGLTVLCAVFVISAANGIEGDLLPYMTRRYFGLQSYSSVYGLLGFAFSLGAPTGSIVMGQTFDRLGGYGPILWVVAGSIFLAALLLVSIGTPKRRAIKAAGGREQSDCVALRHRS
jgi:OFA family oxalate/formate antiporter-like MFS transporter